ncbi:hypothetical protein [Membranihabitans maritimus]|uniref:hypothetical protein n=1 Tax=Membranihabitans maritimus TaxID=2904244 RepID=UPI001F392CD6|nr:hypothetical protein [Membranihabitans maritimus]
MNRNNKILIKIISRLIYMMTAFCLSQNAIYAQVGSVFRGWEKGFLDIHHINTGKGESAFFIFPDGTTMLADAGATGRAKPRVTDAKPNDDKTPGDWIARYILHFLDETPEKRLDYILISHFHDDHMGTFSQDLKPSEKGNYLLSGITEVADKIPFGKLIDRGWPEYNWPRPLQSKGMGNYIRFIQWQTSENNAVAEQFDVGSKDQIKLLFNPGDYPEFSVRNIASNGRPCKKSLFH